MINWDLLFRELGQENLINLAKGNLGYKDLERVARFTPAAADVRKMLRQRKLEGVKQLTRKALKRRGITV